MNPIEWAHNGLKPVGIIQDYWSRKPVGTLWEKREERTGDDLILQVLGVRKA